MTASFEDVRIGGQAVVQLGQLPAVLCGGGFFENLWGMHPEESRGRLYGKDIVLPRWQKAYLRDYDFNPLAEPAFELPECLLPLLCWLRQTIEPRLNGLLVNWYDLSQGHYIGPHRDRTKALVDGSPIVTASFGDQRPLRLRPMGGGARVDVPMQNGSVVVIPWATNLTHKHEVPPRKGIGLRISVTARVFQ